MEKDKKYNVVLGLMIFFFLIVVGVCLAWGLGFIGVKANSEKNINQSEMANSNTSKEQTLNIQETNTNNVTPSNNEIAKETTKSDESTFLNVSLSKIESGKCLNNSGTEYDIVIEDSDLGVNVLFENSKFYLSIQADSALKGYGIKVETDKQYEITGLDISKVSKVFISGWGQAVDFPPVFFIMQDGTVNWLNTEHALMNKDFTVEGTIKNVSNVVEITTVSAFDGIGRGRSIIGIRNDGNFYDLTLETVNK